MNISKDIERLINEIIPPDDYQYRNGFSNTHIIDKLNNKERTLVEEVLINMLSDKTDILIVETLAHLQSIKSLPILYRALLKINNLIFKSIRHNPEGIKYPLLITLNT
jgi:hypothetical protein